MHARSLAMALTAIGLERVAYALARIAACDGRSMNRRNVAPPIEEGEREAIGPMAGNGRKSPVSL